MLQWQCAHHLLGSDAENLIALQKQLPLAWFSMIIVVPQAYNMIQPRRTQ
jgi:hypothetical protein